MDNDNNIIEYDYKWISSQNENNVWELGGGYFWWYASSRGRKAARNNMQLLYRRKNQFRPKTRRRKFKLRVYNKNFVRRTSSKLIYPRKPTFVGLRAKNACRVSYPMMIAVEKAVMPTKQRVWAKYRKYPDFFVTKKSSKSRMGKGKGKIFGRILKIQKGEVIFDLGVSHALKSAKWLGAIKLALPTKTRVVYKGRWAYRRLKNYYNTRAWVSFRKKIKKKKFYQIQAKKFIYMLEGLAEVKYLKTLGPESYYRYRLSRFKAWKDHTQELIQAHKLAACRVSSQLSVLDNLERYVVPETRKNFKAGYSSAGLSGGRLRSFLQRTIIVKNFSRAFFEQEWLPDEDGYYGIYRGANLLMKKKIHREAFSVQKQIPQADSY